MLVGDELSRSKNLTKSKGVNLWFWQFFDHFQSNLAMSKDGGLAQIS